MAYSATKGLRGKSDLMNQSLGTQNTRAVKLLIQDHVPILYRVWSYKLAERSSFDHIGFPWLTRNKARGHRKFEAEHASQVL